MTKKPETVTTACPNHKTSPCKHCDGAGFKVWTRAEWEAKHPPRKVTKGLREEGFQPHTLTVTRNARD